MPEQEPPWDPNTDGGKMLVKKIINHQLILYGSKHGVLKPKNISKLYQVTQGPNEDPSAFYERLCEVARKWTDLNSDDEANKKTFLICCLWHNQPLIFGRSCRELEGVSGMFVSQLIEIANEVYNNQDEVEKKER